MKQTKRIISLILCLLMLVAVVPVMEVSAAGFTPRLSAPTRTGYYGTQNSYNPFWTNSNAGNGNCTWYAWGRAYELLGSRPQLSTGNANTWYPRNVSSGAYPYGSTPKLGAIACWATGSAGHVAIVEAINNDGTITISESSWSATSWWFRTKTINRNCSYYSSFQGFIYIGDFSNEPLLAPSWATITSDYDSIPKGNNINFTFNSERATGYTIGINRENTRILTQDVRNNNFSYTCSMKGDYSAYVTAWNDAGHVDSQVIYFSVYDSKPSYSNIITHSEKIRTGSSIWFEFDSDTATGYTIGIDKDGTRILTQDVTKMFSYVCSSTGSYSAYVTAWNNFGTTDSQRVFWTVYDSKPSYSNISINTNYLETNKTISFSFESDVATGYTIGINKDGSRIITQDVRETSFSYFCDTPGNYSAYVTAWNEIGNIDSNRVYWIVYDANHEHVYSESITKAATCSASGSKQLTCNLCGASKVETIPALGHSYGAWTKLNDTQHQRVCSRNSSHVEKANHTWNSGTVTKAATCAATGVKTYTCTVCNATKTETIAINSSNHVNTTSTAATASTCTVKGYTAGVYCNDCKKYISGHAEQPLAPHQTTTQNAKAATCTAEGYTGDQVCTVCNQTITSGTAIAKKAHTLTTVNQKAATCTAEGYTGDQVCTVCNQTITKGTAIAKKTHTLTTVNQKAAGCTTAGYTGDQICTTCNQTITKGNAVNALGHANADSNGNCTRCGTHIKDVTPSQPSNPQPNPNACKYCGQVHSGPFGWLIKFFHSILAIFKR